MRTTTLLARAAAGVVLTVGCASPAWAQADPPPAGSVVTDEAAPTRTPAPPSTTTGPVTAPPATDPPTGSPSTDTPSTATPSTDAPPTATPSTTPTTDTEPGATAPSSATADAAARVPTTDADRSHGQGTITFSALGAQATPIAGADFLVQPCLPGGDTRHVVTGADGTASAQVRLGCHLVTLASSPVGTDGAFAGPWVVVFLTDGESFHVDFRTAAPAPVTSRPLTVVATTDDGPVPGASFRIRGCGADAAEVAVVHTGADGTVTSELPLGCYDVDLVAWPDGVDPDSGTSWSVELERYGPGGVVTAHFARWAPPPPLESRWSEIVKVDRMTGAPLAGATFRISACHGGFVDQVTTGANGRVPLGTVDGCFRADEVTAPAGYLRDDCPVYFQVRGAGTTVTIRDIAVTQAPVVRDPSVRHPLASIPAGPIDR